MIEQIEKNIKPGSRMILDAAKIMTVPAESIRINGWAKFDNAIRGLRMHEFSIICGPTGSGKTQWLCNLSAKLLLQGVPQFVMSVETGGPDYMIRMLSALSGEDFNTGEKIPKEKVQAAIDRCGDAFFEDRFWLSTYETRIPLQELLDTVTYSVQVLGAKLIVMDNVNYFTEVTCSRDQIVAIDSTIHELVVLSKQLETHIIMVMHPRKTEGGRIENEFDIKGSSTAVQEASNVLLMNRSLEDPLSGNREIKLAKVRKNGRVSGNIILFKCEDGVSYHEAKFAEDYK